MLNEEYFLHKNIHLQKRMTFEVHIVHMNFWLFI